MTFDEILNRIDCMPEASRIRMRESATEMAVSKNSILMEAGKVVPYVYFIKKGILRAYAPAADRDITFWFGTEGDPVLSMKSYVEELPGYEHIELLEDCLLYRMETAVLKGLFSRDIHIANWGRKLAEKELVKTEELIISRQFRTASERYSDLMSGNPGLLQRVPLGHIASYLGISQVSLSRVRAEIR